MSDTAMPTTTGQYAAVNGIQMYYEIHGEGEPLVLLHGGGSTLRTTFGTILPELSKSNKAIALDLQAHGHTSDRDAPLSFKQDAADVIALLDHLGIERADIFGFSNGGQTALELGISYPNRVKKLVVASAFYSRESVPNPFWDGFDQPDFSQMPQIYKDEFLKITGNDAALMNMFRRDVERMRHFKGWTPAQIRSIEAPTLLLIGDRDLTSPEHAVEMYRLLPNSRLAILPGDHGSYMGEAMSWGAKSRIPSLCAEMVTEFLSSER